MGNHKINKVKRKFGIVHCWGSLEEGATVMLDYKTKDQDEVYDLVMDCYEPNIHGNTYSKLISWFYKRGIIPLQLSTDY